MQIKDHKIKLFASALMAICISITYPLNALAGEILLTPTKECTLSFDNSIHSGYYRNTNSGSNSGGQYGGATTNGETPYLNLTYTKKLTFTYSIYLKTYEQFSDCSAYASAYIDLKFVDKDGNQVWSKRINGNTNNVKTEYVLDVESLLSTGYDLSYIKIKAIPSSSASSSGNAHAYAQANMEQEFACEAAAPEFEWSPVIQHEGNMFYKAFFFNLR